MASTGGVTISAGTIVAAAIAAAGPHYLEAVASEFEGLSDDEAWRRFAIVLARAHILASLEGMASMTATTMRAGARFEFQSPEQFDKVTVDLSSLAADGDKLFVKPFEEAVRSFSSKVPMLATTMQELRRQSEALAADIVRAEKNAAVEILRRKSAAIDAAIRSGFYVSDVDQRTVVNLRSLVAQALRGVIGATPESGFEKGMSAGEFIVEAKLQGAHDLTVSRLRTVFRNATNAAYNDGRATILKAPAAKRATPLVVIREIRDRRTRGNPTGLYPDRGKHWQMNGYVGSVEDLERRRLIPPCGHNCRGGIRPMSTAEARSLGLLDRNGNPDPAKIRAHNGDREAIVASGEYPDPGWN